MGGLLQGLRDNYAPAGSGSGASRTQTGGSAATTSAEGPRAGTTGGAGERRAEATPGAGAERGAGERRAEATPSAGAERGAGERAEATPGAGAERGAGERRAESEPAAEDRKREEAAGGAAAAANATPQGTPGFVPTRPLGQLTEVAGKGLSWLGQQVSQGAETFDRGHASIPGPLKAPAAVLSGLGHVVGSTGQFLGNTLQGTGKLLQHDKQTWDKVGGALQKGWEGVAYTGGRGLQAVGNAAGSETLDKAGQKLASVASPGTRETLDSAGEAATHYAARAGSTLTGGVEAGARGLGLTGLAETSGAGRQALDQVSARSANDLTRSIDGAVSDRLQKYAEDPAYFITRDATQVAALLAGPKVASRALQGPAKPLQTAELLPKYSGGGGRHLPETAKGNPVFGSPVKYLDAAEQKAHQLQFKRGKILDAQGKPFDTSQAYSWQSGEGRAIFVMDGQGRFFASNFHATGHFHHSSLVAGRPVAGAGEISVQNGVLKELSNRSGHYRPSPQLDDQVARVLERNGISLKGVNRDVIENLTF